MYCSRVTGMAPGEGRARSTRQLLIQRTRVILVLSLLAGVIFAGLELWFMPGALPPPFYVKMLGITLTAAAFVALGRPWAVRHAWLLSIGIVAVAYVMTAISGIVSPSREYATTAVLFVAAALTTATILPWGVRPQCVTLAVGLMALAVAVLRAEGSLHVAVTDPGAATLITLTLSVLTAREVNRYRLAHRREVQVRRRSEMAIRRLNAQLEQRVLARTAELETANRRLAEEIVERRRAADALRESQAQLADIVGNSTAAISLKDLEGRYRLVNREFERLCRHPRADIIGKTDQDLFPAALADKLSARDGEVRAAGMPVSFEQDFSIERQRSYVCVKFPLRAASGAPYGVGSVSTDISLLKQLQEEVRRRQDELAHVLRLHTIGEMAAALAHEINQPLCAITNYAQGGSQRLRAGAAEPVALLQAFEQIAQEGLRAGEIIRGIRSLMQREGRPSALIDVNALAAEALRVLEPQARLHGVTVHLEGAARMPPVRGHGTQIEQVILNLLLNGVEAIAGTGSTRREVVVATALSGNAVEVAVSDTGVGIAPTVADKLFTPFFTTKTRGLGLGLAISRSIVESHGGRLWATPNAGVGTTFHFSLPTAALDDASRNGGAVRRATPA